MAIQEFDWLSENGVGTGYEEEEKTKQYQD